jgi:hypothetical protein
MAYRVKNVSAGGFSARFYPRSRSMASKKTHLTSSTGTAVPTIPESDSGSSHNNLLIIFLIEWMHHRFVTNRPDTPPGADPTE